MRLVRGPALRGGALAAVAEEAAAFPVDPRAVLSEPSPWPMSGKVSPGETDEDEVDEPLSDEGDVTDWEWVMESNALASRCFCASANCSRNFFCLATNASTWSGSTSAREGVRLELKARMAEAVLVTALGARMSGRVNIFEVPVGREKGADDVSQLSSCFR